MRQHLPLAVLLAWPLAACKTSAPSSGTKDVQTDLIRKIMPVGLIYMDVPSQTIEQYVTPADGKNGIPPSFEGIWWTDAHSIQFAVSFQHAAWNPATRTASMYFTGVGTYSYPGNDPTKDAQQGTESSVPTDYDGYDIVFASDYLSAHLINANTDSNGNRQLTDNGYTMNFVADGDWVRHTPGSPDYHLRRIVKVDGTHDVHFPDYLARFGQWTQVYEAAPGATFQEGPAPSTYAYKAGSTNYLSLAPKLPVNPNSFYNVTYSTSTPAVITDSASTWTNPTRIYTPAQASHLGNIVLKAQTAGTLQLSFTTTIGSFNANAGSVTVNGAAVNGKLANAQTADLITVNLPAGVDPSSSTFTATITPFNGSPSCCFQIYPIYGDTSAVFTDAEGPIGQRLIQIFAPQLAIRYVGDLNAVPSLNYQLSITSN